MRPCSRAMRGSGRWISQLAFRPTRTNAASTAFLVVPRAPPLNTPRSFTRRSPVDEDRDDVRRERGEERERERHVQVQPEIQERLVLEAPARALQQLVLLEEEPVHLLPE